MRLYLRDEARAPFYCCLLRVPAQFRSRHDSWHVRRDKSIYLQRSRRALRTQKRHSSPELRSFRTARFPPSLKTVWTRLSNCTEGEGIKILVSGDNSTVSHNEVNPVRTYLVEKGIPDEDIFLTMRVLIPTAACIAPATFSGSHHSSSLASHSICPARSLSPTGSA